MLRAASCDIALHKLDICHFKRRRNFYGALFAKVFKVCEIHLNLPSMFIREQRRSNTKECLFAENNSILKTLCEREDRCFSQPNMPNYIYCRGRDLRGVRAMFFKMCLPGLERGAFRALGILGCRPCLLSSCLGSDASPVCPCEAQQTPPISPSRTETAGAFQQLDLMRFHHQRG